MTIERITQERDDDCQAACVAMLTDYELDEIHDEYEMPFSVGDTLDLLAEEYGDAIARQATSETVRLLTDLVESFIVSVESPSRERWPSLYEKGLRNEIDHKKDHESSKSGGLTAVRERRVASRAEVYHAMVVHRGRLYDPQDPPYWPSVGKLLRTDNYTNDYEIHDVIVPIDERVRDDDESLLQAAAGIDDRDELPEYGDE